MTIYGFRAVVNYDAVYKKFRVETFKLTTGKIYSHYDIREHTNIISALSDIQQRHRAFIASMNPESDDIKLSKVTKLLEVANKLLSEIRGNNNEETPGPAKRDF